MTDNGPLFAPRGMVHNPDHSTSIKAARKVKRPTIRSKVLAFAEQDGDGFIDEELRTIDPDAPESSLRKRRTELTDDGYILDSGTERKNSKGQDCTVWIHRKFHPAPPPVRPKVKGERAQALARRREGVLMFNALVMAANHHQGAHSEVGRAIADALGIPFPITYANIPAKRPI